MQTEEKGVSAEDMEAGGWGRRDDATWTVLLPSPPLLLFLHGESIFRLQLGHRRVSRYLRDL